MSSDAPDLEESAEVSALVSFSSTSRKTYKCTLVNVFLATLFFIIIVVTLTGINSSLADIDEEVDELEEASEKLEEGMRTNLPYFEKTTWAEMENSVMTQELNFYLWSPVSGGRPTPPRKWVDRVLRPNLASNYGIILNRLDAQYSGCDIAGMKLVCDVRDEVAANPASDDDDDEDVSGSVDLVWINGPNFREMKNRGLLYGPFATLLPNSANFDFTDTAIAVDKGTPIGGYEFPFNSAQSIFLHNEAKVPSPPDTIPSLWAWFEANPGRFVYSSPSTDFTGSAFIRTAFYHFCGPWEDFLGPFNEELYLERVPALWEALRALEPFLYRPSGSSTAWYPESHGDIRQLVANETVWIDFSMSAFEAAQQKQQITNPWPESMKGYLLQTGTIADTNYLAIPVNAPNKQAALVAINYIASAGAMFVRSTPEGWGSLQAFDPTADSIKEWDPAFDYILREESVPSEEELASKRLGDLHSDYVNRLNSDWVTNVRDYQMP